MRPIHVVFFVLGMGAYGHLAAGEEPAVPIGLRIEAPQASYSKYEPIVVPLWITNLSGQEIHLMEPDIPGLSVAVVLTRGGQRERENWHRDGVPWGPMVTLAPGAARRTDLELVDLWPFGLPAGDYVLQVEYRGQGYYTGAQSWLNPRVRSNAVSFTTTPASEAEEKECEQYFQTLRTSGAESKRACAKFLESYPASRFAGRVRCHLLHGLITLGELDAAKEEYAKVLVAKDLSRDDVLEAHWSMACGLQKKGLYQEAIALLEKWPREQENVKERIIALKKKAKEAAATPTKEVQPSPSP